MKINGYILDKYQEKIVKDSSKYLLVIAGAGSGKTLTILGKINYLINYKHFSPKDILCISFTKCSTISLKEKIKNEFNINIETYTFHKLALKIINKKVNITNSYTLEKIIDTFFCNTIKLSDYHMKLTLRYFNKISLYNIKNEYVKFYNNNYKKIELLKKTLVSFINLYKTYNLSLNNFCDVLKSTKKYLYSYYKNKIFLVLALNIYIIYQKYLENNNEIDFNDLIIMAINHEKYNLNYKYIIIDEYQDTSYIRFKLIDNILKETNANLMVVGDDYQSIYRFSGCDISLFLNFKKYYPTANVLKIINTYRNSQEIINIATKFIMKNKIQIDKKLYSTKHISKPLKYVYFSNNNILEKIIVYVANTYSKNIMLLGRNNNDIYKFLNKNLKILNNKIEYLKDKSINISYLTIHSAKGLEEDNIIIINLNNDLLGFPNQIKDNKLFSLITNNNENIKYAEERRLFYVAITRTKNNVFFLINKNSESIFIKEIKKKFLKYIEFINW